jgi:SAM-dependent methyltransferase
MAVTQLQLPPHLRLWSVYNRLWFEAQRSIRWSRPHYQERPAGTPKNLSAHQHTRIQALREKYQVNFESQFHQGTALANYFYLDMLDKASQTWMWHLEPVLDVVDVGSKQFYYASVLHRFFRPERLAGVELEGYRVNPDLYSRYDHAMSYIQHLPNTTYHVMDFCEYEGTADVVTSFYPFVEPESLVRWRLPLNVFHPDAVFQKIGQVLRPGGMLCMVNQGVEELGLASCYLKTTQLTKVGHLQCNAPLLEKPDPPIMSVWKKKT